jgi:hypothetical protein
MIERWRAVPGWEMHYACSSFGRIRRLWPGAHTRAGRVLRNHASAQGPMVHLTRVELERTGPEAYAYVQHHQVVLVHRLVHELFVGPIPPGWLVVFRDGNKTNARADNVVAVHRGMRDEVA